MITVVYGAVSVAHTHTVLRVALAPGAGAHLARPSAIAHRPRPSTAPVLRPHRVPRDSSLVFYSYIQYSLESVEISCSIVNGARVQFTHYSSQGWVYTIINLPYLLFAIFDPIAAFRLPSSHAARASRRQMETCAPAARPKGKAMLGPSKRHAPRDTFDCGQQTGLTSRLVGGAPAV